jgi:protein ImuA
MLATSDRADLLARLRHDIATCGPPGQVDRSAVRTGWPALDRLLPAGGVRRGSLVELLDLGGGAESVAAILTVTACRSPGVVVVVDQAGEFYPPALAGWGVPVERQIVVRPGDDADALWAADQALRSRAAAAVWLWRDRLAPHDFRRLQLSAEAGGAVGLLLRPAHCRGRPTGADVQLAVGPRPAARGWRLHVELTRCRGSTPGAAADIDLEDGLEWGADCDATFDVPATAALAGPADVG